MKYGLGSRVCVIGAGPSGITAAKHLLQVGIRPVVYERGDQVGGNWVYSPNPDHSSVYETTHIISSKSLSQYHDFPMPRHYPDYPSHDLLREYFQSYARYFGVDDVIQFNTSVAQAEKLPDDTWRLTLHDGRVELFDHLLVANGHHWNPRWPSYPGTFAGEYTHSHSYRSHEPYRDKRVLVIGGGNSACDIAVDISRHAAFTAISWRRGYYIIPKFIFGQPSDTLNSRVHWLPRSIRQRSLYWVWKLATGGNSKYGLPEPDFPILASHPTMNTDFMNHLRHGDVQARPDIARFEGRRVVFVDGRSEAYDAVIAATGYTITHPFFDPSFINYSEGDVPLYLHVFHPDHPSLYFIGLVQPMGCIWPLADVQAQLVANRIAGRYVPPSDMRQRIEARIHEINGRYRKAARHTIEVEYHEYLGQLRHELPADAPDWGAIASPA